ncbi:T6SS immunity protein Tdi1 domain-containing protein [Streptomyces sp. NPDC058052]|uniref:T6SS immunity protein Tdi1 domain-containing protein n=1 Tax=Streptomyces sp. NPDC058052 TaxID=3346316 RepID=UPI0036E32DA4
MSLEILLRRFPVTGTADPTAPGEGGHPVPATLSGLFEQAEGSVLADGFLRFHTPKSARESYEACARMIEGIEGRYYPFAFDWSGRELLFDIRDPEAKPRYVIAVDPAEGEHLTTGLTIDEFFEAVADEDEDALAFPYFQEWREANPGAAPLGFGQVVAYKVPLALGGSDEVANMEVSDQRVYFELCTQLALQLRDLPEGTEIGGATIAPPEPGA